MENVNISVDPLVSPSTDFEEWSDQVDLLGTAVYSTSENVTLNNVSVSGYNNAGLYLILKIIWQSQWFWGYTGWNRSSRSIYL